MNNRTETGGGLYAADVPRPSPEKGGVTNDTRDASSDRGEEANHALSPDPVSTQDVELLIRTAHLAPSCFNNQPWRFVIIDDAGTIAAVKEAMSKGNYWASPVPVIIALASKRDLDCKLSDGHDYFLFGCGMAASHLMLQATSMGLVARLFFGALPPRG